MGCNREYRTVAAVAYRAVRIRTIQALLGNSGRCEGTQERVPVIAQCGKLHAAVHRELRGSGARTPSHYHSQEGSSSRIGQHLRQGHS